MRQDTHRVSRHVTDAVASHDALDQRREKRIKAFPNGARPAVERLARLSPAIEDLAESFPALLFALATGYGSDAARNAALRAVAEGLPLREAATRLELPFWLRKLPPAAFNAPLVNPPSDAQLVNRLLSLIPQTPASAAAWLERVLIAHHTGRPDLTLWVAQQYRAAQPSPRSASFLGVLAWAWFSGSDGEKRAEKLVNSRWKPTLGAQRAAAEARLWRERIALDVCLGPGLTDTWIEPATCGDLAFVPLRNADDFIAEARAMDNCLDRYADRIEGRIARLFSVRRDGRSIANLEIAPHEGEPGHPVIAQLRGPHNRRAPIEVWQAAYAWLGSQPLRLADRRLEVKVGRAVRERRQMEIWSPFIDVLPPHAKEAFLAAFIARSRRQKAARRS